MDVPRDSLTDDGVEATLVPFFLPEHGGVAQSVRAYGSYP